MRRRRMLAAGLSIVVGVGGVVTAAVGWSDVQPAVAAGPGVTGSSTLVTLITGDQVTVATLGSGAQAAAVVRDRPGIGYQISSGDGHTYVLPSDAVSLVESGQVDRRLFDVSLLARLGYDDAHRADIPLLVSGATGTLSAKKATVSAAVTGLGISPVNTRKSDTAELWKGLRDSKAPTLAGGVRRVWLDGKAFVSLDQSTVQIGAPAAWQAGFTGKGVKVAVLDTGYDASHPDLKDSVVAAMDFTGSSDGVEDLVGHGTHVASIVGGSGAASGGTYRGVAPDASLLVGKVCDVSGCPDSAILAGMAWAVQQQAKVVNLSLGCPPYFCVTDGSDPMSQAINTLSADSGTLFVVSAGNDGQDSMISTPAAAAEALAVGSVGRQDGLSVFSSRGPRSGDYAIKPDITAPGEDIVAARASKADPIGEPVGEDYQRLSGTSMASPHVAGAAAILAQQHPDWTGSRLKAALMSTSRGIAGASVYGQGAGRVDVARAVTQPVAAEPGSVSFGNLSWPHTGQAPVPAKVTYRNDADRPIVLALTLAVADSAGKAAAAGTFTVDKSELTVPAHAAAEATVTLNPGAGGVGLFGGWLTATGTGADSGVVVRTPVGAYNEEERYTVTVAVTGRDGKPTTDCHGVVRAILRTEAGYVDQLERNTRCTNASGTVTMRTPPGHLALVANTITEDSEGYLADWALVAMPDLNVTKDTAVTADMRTAKPVNVALTGEPTARPAFTATAWHLGADVRNVFAGSVATYTTTMGSPANDFGFQVRATYVQPMVSMRVVGGDEQPVSRNWAGGLLLGDHQAPLVNGGNGSPQDLAKVTVKGSIVLIWPDGDPGPAIAALADGGALAVLLPSTYFGLSPTTLPILSTTGPAAARALIAALAKQALTVRTHGIRNSPYQYELVFHRNGGMPDGATYQSRKEDLAAVRARYHHAGGDAIAMTPNMATPTGGMTMFGGTPRIWLPAERVNYFTPDAVTWNEKTYLGDFTGPLPGIYDVKAPSTYAARRPYTEDWLAAATGNRVSTPFVTDPTGNAIPWAYRSGDTVTVALPSLSDSNPSHLGFAFRPDTGSTVLTRGATEIGRTSRPGSGVFTVPAGADTYQLSSQTQRELPTYWVLSTDVHTVWTFNSTHVDGTERRPLPLLDVDLRLPVDLANSLPAGRTSEVEISVGAQPGTSTPTVRQVEVDVSYDGGSTWQHGTVQGSGTAWRATLPGGGAPGGFAALRAKVTDASGATIEETIIRAYALR